ncbi:SUF system NifU family Fe-S cluster assembly protein [Thermoplasmatales archaeon AK]|nr:SUF system NifU family Fe-S cluster assembly protein [Thermoplasmatales archaeon AK]
MKDQELQMEIILDNYRNPHNYGRIEDPSVKLLEYNPVCGDAVELFLKIDGDRLSDVRFIGRGCSISQGAASILTDLVKGKSVEDVKKLTKEQFLDIIGLDLGPSREKCALLSYNTLMKCLEKT